MKRLALIILTLLAWPTAVPTTAAPSRDPQLVLPQLRAWHEHGSFARLEELLGMPDEDVISGFSVTEFKLVDGSSVFVKATPSHNRIYTISRRVPGRLAETLYDPLVSYLDHPLPASAPF